MVTPELLRKTALSFAETSEQPHFEKTSFRVGNKIFATYDKKENKACVKLSLTDQNVFSSFDKDIFTPIPNKWGLLGWTNINLEKVRQDMFMDILTLAYNEVAPKRLIIKEQ